MFQRLATSVEFAYEMRAGFPGQIKFKKVKKEYVFNKKEVQRSNFLPKGVQKSPVQQCPKKFEDLSTSKIAQKQHF